MKFTKQLMRLALVLAILLSVTVAFAGTASETKTDDASITTGYGYFLGIIVVTDGTNAVTLDIYDSTAASGRKLIPTTTIPTGTSNRFAVIGFADGDLYYYAGIYVDVTCAGTVSYMVYYDPVKQ
jgi:hypothetical protein